LRKIKILFVVPTREWLRIKHFGDRPKGTLFLRLPSLSAAIIATLTPKEYEFKLIDEQLDFLDYQEKTDLVAITCNTATANRAYEIAKNYHKKNIPVVLGGIHPTLNITEASKYGTVVVGPAEPVWKNLIDDFKNNRLKKIYESPISGLELITPDRTVFNGKKYLTTNLIEASRGCINFCDFCSTASAFNGKYVTKDIAVLIGEIKNMGSKTILFVDDNLNGDKEYAKKLFKALIPLKIKWGGQITYDFGLDEEMLKLAQKSGCVGVFIGFDSISNQTLKNFNKIANNADLYKKAIRNIRKNNIMIQGSFIFGNDGDTNDIFKNTLNFILSSKIDAIFLGISTPLPSTKFYSKMKKGNRITDFNWENYDYRHCVIKPLGTTCEEILSGINHIHSQFFRLDRMFLRFLRTFIILVKNGSFFWLLSYNLGFLSRIKLLRK